MADYIYKDDYLNISVSEFGLHLSSGCISVFLYDGDFKIMSDRYLHVGRSVVINLELDAVIAIKQYFNSEVV